VLNCLLRIELEDHLELSIDAWLLGLGRNKTAACLDYLQVGVDPLGLHRLRPMLDLGQEDAL